MRAIVRVAFGAVIASLALTVTASTAFAATAVTEPAGGTATVGVADDGYPAAVTVTVRGFEPFSNVFIEQCNGRSPAETDWRAQVDCDPGSAPAAAVADENGVATFAATDRNHALRAFVGPSPQGAFNCLGPSAVSPKNQLEDYRNCQLRVSSTNAETTSDQVFVRLELPNHAKPWDPSIVPGAVAPPAAAKTASGAAAASNQSAAKQGAAASGQAAGNHDPSTSSSSDGVSVTTSLGGLLLVAAVLAGGAFWFMRRRRTRRVAA